jgi:hypothetical protein
VDIAADGAAYDHRLLCGDATSPEALWVEAYRLFSGNVAYVWHAAGKSLDVGLMLRELGFEIRAQLIWC